ncbi:ATP-dependent protease La Type II [Methylophaga thiooxydans]|uniref:endopeptidase La n=1 Tax=Methylophaga thiooxydans TaxID=392484 RepID=A0A0A0BE27_9GAMM|nr:ATP-binding protein [Methylophaga thiooxydans]KGM05967.1 ATP-dependent protease La Type II [Methylophaga thiooxydans]
MQRRTELQASDLYQYCDPNSWTFSSTAELETLPTIIGQERALSAIDFGVNIDAEGYNLFIMGPAGVGKYTMIKRFLDEHAKHRPKAKDWAYLNNFADSQKPWVVSMPAGQGNQLRHDIEAVVAHLETELPQAFDDEYYRGRMRSLDEAARKHRVRLFGTLQSEADRKGVVLLRMQDGSYAFAAQRNGEAMTSEEFEQLPAHKQEQTEEAIADLHEDLQHTLLELREWERDNLKKVQALNDEVALEVISKQVNKLKHAYPSSTTLQQYFDAMQNDIRDNVEVFVKQEASSEEAGIEDSLLKRYQINLVVDNSQSHGAPIIYENLPNHQTLLGCVENMAMMGALVTDFSLIKAGAVHRANGGYLIIDAEQLLMQPFGWEGLKRALKSKEVRFDTLERIYSLVATVSLEPEPIPLDLKVVLLGDRHLYYLLYEMDPEFAGLFKIVADFEEHMPRTADNDLMFARMMASTIETEKLLQMDRSAVARVIEHSARSIEDSYKFSLHLGDMTDLLRESSFLAGQAEAKVVSQDHVQHAINLREHRVDRLRGQIHDQIDRQVIDIDVTGHQIGQVNALSVMSLGGFSFGQPSRVTASARFGDDNIVDIEREVDLGGDIHAKGVLILSGYLGTTYAADSPLSMSASIVFEQNYGEVDGDSATVAELCALLSSIAGVSLKQSIAITGSMNQHGDVQAIGGVNEKIEGFFDICLRKGLTGKQGVIIPASNVQHLMLRQDVITAVAKDKFHIHAINHVSDALTLLSGLDAGERNTDGEFSVNSFNAAVAVRLQKWADVHRHEKEAPAE